MTVSFEKRLAELDAYLQMLIDKSEALEKKSVYTKEIAKVSIKTTATNEPSSPFQSIDGKALSCVSELNQAVSRNQSYIDVQNFSPQAPIRVARRQQRQSQPSSTPPISSSPLTPRNVHQAQVVANQSQEPQLILKASLSSNQEVQQNYDKSAYRRSIQIEEEKRFRASQKNQDNTTTFDKSVEIYPGAAKERLKDGATICPNDLDEDDDDAFYDAADVQHNSHQIIITPKKPNPLCSNSLLLAQTAESTNSDSYSGTIDLIMSHSNNNNNLITAQDGSIDWDDLYGEEEEDLGSLENQGSVIKHLMSQIRIGMDLTKVVLPTFILERRSLLEMYADFFAHPDLFSAIPDYESPEERMVQIVRWYLSAFHAGRKSSVAKKPYNPILGEIFLCHWNLDNEPNSDADKSTSISHSSEQIRLPLKTTELERSSSTESTDIEKFSKQLPTKSLLFVAEQVSHHPPVSAFYAENPDKQISCSAHIYTKSKYLGLSVGVHNIGEGIIDVLKHNETYVCTFPSAYGRSILTVPWVELGGSVNITCEQTGYSASIEFVTKPFYGGKKHRVMGEILRPNKEPFLNIDGEWNGCMYCKSPSGSSQKQVFVDTTCLPVIKKQVRSISSQESFESRNVWKEVTRALKLHDVNGATASKSFIEQRQRDLLKERLEKGIKWKTRYFEAADEGWRYAKPLSSRLPPN